jgi:hypothetical protein
MARSRGLGDVYKRQTFTESPAQCGGVFLLLKPSSYFF